MSLWSVLTRPVALLRLPLLLTLLIGLLLMSLSVVALVLLPILRELQLTSNVLTVLLVFKLFVAFWLLVLFVLVLVRHLFMLIMTRKKRQIYGFIGRKFSNPEVAAIMDDLDLLPEPFITPLIVEQFRSELREKLLSSTYDRQLVRMLVEACWSMLNTEYGKDLIREYSEKFSSTVPFNRM